jgi:hypothetical protein
VATKKFLKTTDCGESVAQVALFNKHCFFKLDTSGFSLFGHFPKLTAFTENPCPSIFPTAQG